MEENMQLLNWNNIAFESASLIKQKTATTNQTVIVILLFCFTAINRHQFLTDVLWILLNDTSSAQNMSIYQLQSSQIPSVYILVIYGCSRTILCSSRQLFYSYRRAAIQLQNAAKHFEGLHSVFAASCNFNLAEERLVKCCKSAAYQLYSYFEALLWRCTALSVSYGICEKMDRRKMNFLLFNFLESILSIQTINRD